MSQWSNSARIVCLAALLGCLPFAADARGTKPSVPRTDPGSAAIASAVGAYLSPPQTTHADPVSVALSSTLVADVSISNIKTLGGWATARAKKRGLDPVDVVLKREKGHWVGVVYGTNLAGVGAKYHIPRRVWRKIGMAPYSE